MRMLQVFKDLKTENIEEDWVTNYFPIQKNANDDEPPNSKEIQTEYV